MANTPKKDINTIQQRAIDEASHGLMEQRAVMINAPTGAGKTRILSKTIEAISPGKVLFLTHRDALTEQNEKSFRQWVGKRSTSFGTDGRLDQGGDIVFANVQTAAARVAELARYDLVVIDEAHHASEAATGRQNDYTTVIDAAQAKNGEARILTATATPNRPDERGLHPVIAGAKTVVIGMRELEDAGQIILPNTRQLRIITNQDVDMLRAAQQRFDWMNAKEHEGVNKALRNLRPDDYHHQAAQQWMRMAGNMRTIAFEERIENARRFVDEVRSLGVKAAVIDSRQDAAENKRILEAYRRGDIQLLSSVSKLDEGIDVPSTKCTLILRGTTSAIQYSQMVGRAMRGNRDVESERPIVLDAGASTMIHGAVEQRAKVAEYFKHLERGDISQYRMRGSHYLPHRSGEIGFSPWAVINDKPPIIGLSDSQGMMLARPRRTHDDRVEFQMANIHSVRGATRLELLKDEQNRPIRRLNAHDLEEIEGKRVMPSRAMITRLAATPSLDGRSTLQDEKTQQQGHRHISSFIQMTDMARQAASKSNGR